MSNNGDKSKKGGNSFKMLSQKMNEMQKSKKPVWNFRTSSSSKSNSNKSSENLNKSDSSSIIEIDIENDNMSQPGFSGYKSVHRDPDVPDRSYGDYYCPLCDSHMNSDGMWAAHISGKRHLKNVDKGSKDPKYEDLDVESIIKQDIKNVKDPVIGLSYIHEIRRRDKGAPPIFTCFLCQATFPTAALIIEHALTIKHRMNFMKENSPDDYQLLEATNLKKGHMEPLVEEMTSKLEKKFGKGAVKVKLEKLKIPPAYTYSSKRSFSTDDDEEKHPRKNMKPGDKDSYSWKRVQQRNEISEKDKYSRDIDRRRYSSSEDEDTYRQCSPSKKSQNKNGYDDTKRYESSLPRDSYKKDSFYSKRAVSPQRPSHSRSFPPREPVEERKNYKIPYGPDPPPFLNTSSHQYREKSPAKKLTPPNHPVSGGNKDNAQLLKEFLQKMLVLPPEIFFKLVLMKMENLEMRSVEELSLMTQIYSKADKKLKEIMPPETLDVFVKRLTQSEDVPRNSSQSLHQNHDSSTCPTRPQPQGDLSFIREFLDFQRSSTVVSSPLQPSVGGGVGVPPENTPSFAFQTFASLNQTYRMPSVTHGNSSQTYGMPSVTHGNSSQTYGNQIQSHSTQGNRNTYQNKDQLYASSFLSNSYNSATSSNSSGIPGLTLTEEENREKQNYSYGFSPNPSSHYPSYGY